MAKISLLSFLVAGLAVIVILWVLLSATLPIVINVIERLSR